MYRSPVKLPVHENIEKYTARSDVHRNRGWSKICVVGITLLGLIHIMYAWHNTFEVAETKTARSKANIPMLLNSQNEIPKVGLQFPAKSKNKETLDHVTKNDTPPSLHGLSSNDSVGAGATPQARPINASNFSASLLAASSLPPAQAVGADGLEGEGAPQQPAQPAATTPDAKTSVPLLTAEQEMQAAGSPPGPWSESNPARRIAVVGLYNSGSSVLAGLLAALGVHMGARKNWAMEEMSMTKFLGTAWYEPWGLERRFLPEQRVQRLRAWAIREERAARGAPVGLKHPLLSLSAADTLAAWGNGTAFVWAHRPLAESIERLHRRGWWRRLPNMTDARAHEVRASLQTKLWRSLRAFFECGPDGGDDSGAAAADAATCRAHRPLVVSHKALRADPRGEVGRIVRALGLRPTAEQVESAVAAVKKPGH